MLEAIRLTIINNLLEYHPVLNLYTVYVFPQKEICTSTCGITYLYLSLNIFDIYDRNPVGN